MHRLEATAADKIAEHRRWGTLKGHCRLWRLNAGSGCCPLPCGTDCNRPTQLGDSVLFSACCPSAGARRQPPGSASWRHSAHSTCRRSGRHRLPPSQQAPHRPFARLRRALCSPPPPPWLLRWGRPPPASAACPASPPCRQAWKASKHSARWAAPPPWLALARGGSASAVLEQQRRRRDRLTLRLPRFRWVLDERAVSARAGMEMHPGMFGDALAQFCCPALPCPALPCPALPCPAPCT